MRRVAENLTETSTDVQADEKAIQDLVDTWLVASAQGDHETVLELMTDDVVFMVPDQEPFGKEAFKAISEQMKGVRMKAEHEIKELHVLGDWAYLRGRLNITMTPQGGGAPAHRSGYTLTLLQKGTDGKWRIARDANLVTPDG